MVDYIMLGAGISALTLAQMLAPSEQTFLLLEKSSGVGGRLATRRTPHAKFDHGAQFYRHNDDFSLHPLWVRAGLTLEWFRRPDGGYWTSPQGMTALAKKLTAPEHVRLNSKVVRLDKIDAGWQLTCDNQSVFTGRKAILTSPLPQSLQLLEDSALTYPARLKSLSYAKAIVGLFELSESSSKIGDLVYQENVSLDIYSIANQQAKGLSPSLAFTVVMQPYWSETMFELPPAELKARLQTCFANFLAPYGSFHLRSVDLKLWRYAQPLLSTTEGFVEVHDGLFLTGDAFGGPSIHGAVRAALRLAQHFLPQSGRSL